MTEQKYLEVKDILGAPIEAVRRETPYLKPILTTALASSGTGQTGSMRMVEITRAGIYLITAQGASGSLGTHVRNGTSYASDPGHAAIVKSKVPLAEGDKLLIIIGQQGSNKNTDTVTDGSSGGGGGGTFVFREIPAITDSSYQISIAGKHYECLVVAAGGGGTQDNCYKQSSANGYDASTQLYSLNNFKSYSTSTRAPTTSGGASGVLGLTQIATYYGKGGYYRRNKNYCYGGYGCGGCADDSYTYGGGWCAGESYRAASWAKTGGTLTIADAFSDGSLTLERTAYIEVFAWWTPVTDRVLDDCVYGNSKGCIDSVLLNRLEADTDYIKYLLDEHHLKVSELSTVDTVWHRKLYLLYGEMERIRSNIETIRSSSIIETSTPIPQEVKGCDKPGYAIINEWERIMYDMHSILIGITMGRRPLGTFNCGFAYTEQKLYLGGE